MNEKRRDYSYTLVEITVTLVIVTILASLVSVQYFRTVEKSRQAEAIEILTRVYRGYKILIVDELLDSSYQINNPDNQLTNQSNSEEWDPGIPNSVQNTWAWGVLGFEENPNTNAALDFAYDFLPKGINAEGAGCGGAGGYGSFLANPHNLAIARRKDNAGNPTCDRYIYIDCDNGTIIKSNTYQ